MMKAEVLLAESMPQSAPTPAGMIPASEPAAFGPGKTTDANHFKTKGEKKFDRLTYGGIGYLANVALSLAAVFWVERTPMGQRFMDGFVQKVAKIPKVNAKSAQFLASKSFFLTGGFAVLVPMKMLEDRKVELVKKWDRDAYGEAADTNPDIVRAHQDLEAAPKQNWLSIMGSRVLSLIPFYATVGLLWSNKSPLAKATNPDFRKLDKTAKQAVMALEDTDLSRFTKTMSKGWGFDRLIVSTAREAGKLGAKITGNESALKTIRTMEETYPGMMKEGSLLPGASPAKAARDPNLVAWPYYFVSEMITSAMVAWGVYAMTRVLAPIIGNKQAAPAPQPAAHTPPPLSSEQPKIEETRGNAPHPQVKHIEYQSRAVAPQLEAAK